jgi:hypothetical protein
MAKLVEVPLFSKVLNEIEWATEHMNLLGDGRSIKIARNQETKRAVQKFHMKYSWHFIQPSMRVWSQN